MVFPSLHSPSGVCVCLGKGTVFPKIPKVPLTLRQHTMWGRGLWLWVRIGGGWSPPRTFLTSKVHLNQTLSLNLQGPELGAFSQHGLVCLWELQGPLAQVGFLLHAAQGRTMWTLASLSHTRCFSMSQAASLSGWVDVARSTSSTSRRARMPPCAR